MTPPRSFALLALALGTIVGLGLGEVAIRTMAARNPAFAEAMRSLDPLGSLVEPLGAFGYRQRPGATFHYRNGTSARANDGGYRGPFVGRERQEGSLRVLLLGGSTSHGWGVDDTATIDVHMRRLLGEALPGVRVDVVNLAFDGYDSNQDVERLLLDGLGLAPDAVIFNSGINDVYNARLPGLVARDTRTVLWFGELERQRRERAQGGPSLRSRAKHYSYLLRAASYLRLRVTRARAVKPPADTVNWDAVEFFGRNAQRVVELGAQRQFAVLLSSPPSSLRTRYRPEETSHQQYWIRNAATTQQVRDSLDARLTGLAARWRDSATHVAYVPHALPPGLFLDDCHLTGAGNAAIAADFVNALLRLPQVALLRHNAGLAAAGAQVGLPPAPTASAKAHPLSAP